MVSKSINTVNCAKGETSIPFWTGIEGVMKVRTAMTGRAGRMASLTGAAC